MYGQEHSSDSLLPATRNLLLEREGTPEQDATSRSNIDCDLLLAPTSHLSPILFLFTTSTSTHASLLQLPLGFLSQVLQSCKHLLGLPRASQVSLLFFCNTCIPSQNNPLHIATSIRRYQRHQLNSIWLPPSPLARPS
jgi:hypothetical protein